MTDIETQVAALRDALERHLGVRGTSLAQQVRRAGRVLPRRLRAQAGLLAKAEALAGNPRLLQQLDDARLAQALEDLNAYIAGIDRGEAVRTQILSIAAAIAFNLILLFAAIVVVLRLQGVI
ncbi:hypothetical protein So717_38800 [Roseobacter cerasinus]|uniref:Uncharacterized protein n=1 Tax=Roseobacter cerasinus TaxID=2602289 RepID=A0A640VW66_9RHOB|nr:hypothetical protein [Roseobacter cerasinus]GFE52127.1 hypothetical protein So717_38800 [Roseobacter cerasinus]